LKHYFSVEAAEIVGIPAAIIFENIAFWIEQNEKKKRNFHDGKTWTFSSVRAFAELFPYLSEKQVRGALDKLTKADLIAAGNFNKMKYDKTKWYSLTEKGRRIYESGQPETPGKSSRDAEKGKPIPNIKNKLKKENIKENKGKIILDPFLF
jgi:DNA-binding PadR family transcriptional regulator